ncbi:hypothetical protein G7054_g14554 [Neopestalotiopsis clavispora]|nr:hypothetical protein G7054_g14554 [Neopestalotiopsis clavispora]
MASSAPQILVQLGVQFFPSTGSCSIDIAAAINLGRCGYIDIGVEEQHHVDVLPDKICVTPTQPEPLVASSLPPLPPVRTSPPTFQVPVGGSGNGNGNGNGNHNSGSNNGNNSGNHNNNNNVIGYSKNNFGIINNGGSGNHEHDNVNNSKNDNKNYDDNVHHDGGDGSSSSSCTGSNSYTTQPDYCQRPTYEIDITSIPDLSTSDIEAHLALLGLKVDVNVDLDLGLGLGGGVLGRRGLLGGRPGSRSSSDDARAVRQALRHIYNVRCGRSLHAHPRAVGCRAVDLASCLDACSAAAVRSGRALECVGATYMRRSSSSASSTTTTNSNSNNHHGGNKAVTTTIATTTEETSTTTNCWFVLGETHDILDVNVSAELETYDSLFIAA